MKKSILRILAIGYLLMSFCLLDSVEAENLTASINIEVINQVDVATNKQSSDIDETFMFVIEALDKESPLPNSVTTSVKGNGKTSFEQLTFSEVGQYHYKIHQLLGKNSQYHYDETVYEVVIYVLYNEQSGALETNLVSNKLGETEKSELIFKQEYSEKTPEPHQPDTTEKEKPQKKRNGILPSTGEMVSYVSALGIVLVATITLYSIYKELKTSK